jgi:hypothetical protein
MKDDRRHRFKEVSPGNHTLRLRHADTGHQERREVEVQAGKTIQLAIEWKKAEKK